MASGFEGPIVKSVVDALMVALRKARTRRLKGNAEEALSQAVRELLLINPNLNQVDAAIATAKATAIISNQLFLAEEMRSRVACGPTEPRGTKKKLTKKAAGKKMSKKLVKKAAPKGAGRKSAKR
jgi:hypothetical protein